MYDFDRTLCAKDMQEYSFIPSVGMEASEFWKESNQIAVKNNMDKILAYMFLMIRAAKEKGVSITRQSFMNLGKDVVFLKGVKSWFKRINQFGESLGVEVEHYILSSGLKEIIEGTDIAKYFKRIYACEFHYNKSGNADWPKQVVNFTTKTQFVFRISKGSLDQQDDIKLNSVTQEEERHVPYRNMIYIGDGITDVPCMRVVRINGGESIAIYHKDNVEIAKRLLHDKRVGYICKADYSQNSELESIVKLLIHQMALTTQLTEIHDEQYKEYLKQGIDKKEAYQKANYDAIKKYNGLEAAERYRKSHQNTNPVYEQNQKKSNGAGSDSKSGRNTATTIDYSYKFDRELANFNDDYEIRTTVDKDLILVQYSSDAPDASLCYWTTIDEANGITTLNDYMDKLALSKDWGNRNTVKVARISAGTEVKYAVGTAREQLLIADPRPGGGVQYLFNQFDTDWITEIRSFSN